VVIGLDLDDSAADVVNEQGRTNQFRRDLKHRAGEEWSLEASQ
jgi:hypothetical protein